MRVVAWIVEGTWRACVDAVLDNSPADADVMLVHVLDEEVSAVAHGSFAGLLGRRHPDHDPGLIVDEQATTAAHELMEEAGDRLGRAYTPEIRHGRVEREVVLAAAGSDLLVVVRDGDATRLGPKSLGRAGRFIVDHAPCDVLLVWPESAPGMDTAPPPPHPHPPHPGPPHEH